MDPDTSDWMTTGTSEPVETVRKLRELPGPRGVPVLGNLLEIDRERTHASFEAFCRDHGPLFSFRLGTERCVGVGDAELVRVMLRERPHDFRRMNAMERIARELGMHGLFSAEGADWKRQRALITPAFRDENLARHFDVLKLVTERFVALLEREAVSGEPIDILHHLMRFTVDVMAEVAFGRDMNTLERGSDELQRHFETIFPNLWRRIIAPVPYWRWLRLSADRDLDRSLLAARAALDPLIEQSRSELLADPERRANPRTLLESMVAATADGEGRLTNDEVFANVLTLLLAGEDTTANTLAWMTYFLARHRDVQRELRREVDAVFGRLRVLPAHGAASQLRYLAAVAHETLRLKSPAPFIALAAARDVRIADVAVPEGTPVFVLTRHFAMNPDAFPDPHEFDPRRWLNPDATTRATLARSSIPFGAGPRVCPGRQLALLECSLLISALVRNFELELPRDLEVGERFDFAMEPENLRVLVRVRGA